MKMIVGLGNPGKKYTNTRHNVGFDAIASIYRRAGNGDFWTRAKSRFEALSDEVVVPGFNGSADERVLLIAPMTFMNLSGRSLKQFSTFYKTAPADVLVICDDMNIETGRLRLRASGSAGGQKGLQNIIEQLGTQDVPRLRIGVGRPPEGVETVDYVLGTFRSSEKKRIEEAIDDAALGAEYWAVRTIDAVMNHVNAPK